MLKGVHCIVVCCTNDFYHSFKQTEEVLQTTTSFWLQTKMVQLAVQQWIQMVELLITINASSAKPINKRPQEGRMVEWANFMFQLQNNFCISGRRRSRRNGRGYNGFGSSGNETNTQRGNHNERAANGEDNCGHVYFTRDSNKEWAIGARGKPRLYKHTTCIPKLKTLQSLL